MFAALFVFVQEAEILKRQIAAVPVAGFVIDHRPVAMRHSVNRGFLGILPPVPDMALANILDDDYMSIIWEKGTASFASIS